MRTYICMSEMRAAFWGTRHRFFAAKETDAQGGRCPSVSFPVFGETPQLKGIFPRRIEWRSETSRLGFCMKKSVLLLNPLRDPHREKRRLIR